MARAKAAKSENTELDAQAIGASLQRIENLLALLLISGKNETESVKLLSGVGYSAGEIAKLLGKKAHWVSVTLHRSRKDSS